MERKGRLIALTEQIQGEEPPCQHRKRHYIVNLTEYKLWRCVDCGLISREEA